MIRFPELALSMVNKLITVATFDVLPTNDIWQYLVNAPVDEEQEDDKFADSGFESPFMIINLGTIYITIGIILTLPIVVLLTRPCS